MRTIVLLDRANKIVNQFSTEINSNLISYQNKLYSYTGDDKVIIDNENAYNASHYVEQYVCNLNF